jgi:hypothetical protein
MPGSSFVRTAGLWLIVGSIIGIGVGIKEALFPTPFALRSPSSARYP